MNVLKPFPRHISYGHRAMYLGPAALMGNAEVTVIDVACGDGYGYLALATHNAMSSYWGIDSNPADIENGRRLVNGRKNVRCYAWRTVRTSRRTPF